MEREWRKSTIDELIKSGYAELQTGPFGTVLKAAEYVKTGVPLISVREIRYGYFDISDETPRVNAQTLERLPKYILKEGDIVFGRKGGIDRNAIVKNDQEGWFLGSDGIRLRLSQSIDHSFFSYQMRSPLIRNWLIQNSEGTTMPSLNQKVLGRISVNLPPLNVQKAIANILGTLDDKIELNRQMNATLEAIAQALFMSWFVDFDPVIDNALAAGNPIPQALQKRAEARKALGDQRQPLPEAIQKQFCDRFVFNDDLGWVPEGWVVRSVEDVIQINPKVILKKGEIAPFVDMKALPTSGFDISAVIKKEYGGGAKFQQGDVLFARITPCLETGKAGLVDFLDETEVGFGSTEFIVMRGNDSLKTAFVACLSRYTAFRSHCELGMVGSSGRQRVQNSSFGDYFLALPSNNAVLKEFERIASPSFDKMSASKNESKSLSKLRDTLLPKLLSGQLRIPDAEKRVAEVL